MLNKLIVNTLPIVPKPILYIFAKKYIAGPKLEDAVRVAKELESIGGTSTMDVLGEFVTTKEEAIEHTSECMKVLDAINENNLKSYLSIKPTSLGLEVDYDLAYDNIQGLIAHAKELGLWVRLDMENSPYTTQTLDLYRQLRNNGYDNCGIVLQAYMKRSEDDIKAVADLKPSVRLCKGIYNESPKIAYKDFHEIQNNYKKLLRMIIDYGCFPAIATHDEALIRDALNLIKERSLRKSQYEFQMLLGVREDRRNELLQEGHNLRVYVPYGKDWYGYSTRRLKENPQMAGHIIKSIFSFNKKK